jgi:hypothetical protein
MKRNWVKIVIMVVLFLTIAIAGFGQAVYHLWNWLMPSLFGLHPITFWQAVGLLALSWVLFGGWRWGGRPSYSYRRDWRRRMAERWEQMTPEEREKFRQGMWSRCGSSAPHAGPEKS